MTGIRYECHELPQGNAAGDGYSYGRPPLDSKSGGGRDGGRDRRHCRQQQPRVGWFGGGGGGGGKRSGRNSERGGPNDPPPRGDITASVSASSSCGSSLSSYGNSSGRDGRHDDNDDNDNDAGNGGGSRFDYYGNGGGTNGACGRGFQLRGHCPDEVDFGDDGGGGTFAALDAGATGHHHRPPRKSNVRRGSVEGAFPVAASAVFSDAVDPGDVGGRERDVPAAVDGASFAVAVLDVDASFAASFADADTAAHLPPPPPPPPPPPRVRRIRLATPDGHGGRRRRKTRERRSFNDVGDEGAGDRRRSRPRSPLPWTAFDDEYFSSSGAATMEEKKNSVTTTFVAVGAFDGADPPSEGGGTSMVGASPAAFSSHDVDDYNGDGALFEEGEEVSIGAALDGLNYAFNDGNKRAKESECDDTNEGRRVSLLRRYARGGRGGKTLRKLFVSPGAKVVRKGGGGEGDDQDDPPPPVRVVTPDSGGGERRGTHVDVDVSDINDDEGDFDVIDDGTVTGGRTALKTNGGGFGFGSGWKRRKRDPPPSEEEPLSPSELQPFRATPPSSLAAEVASPPSPLSPPSTPKHAPTRNYPPTMDELKSGPHVSPHRRCRGSGARPSRQSRCYSELPSPSPSPPRGRSPRNVWIDATPPSPDNGSSRSKPRDRNRNRNRNRPDVSPPAADRSAANDDRWAATPPPSRWTTAPPRRDRIAGRHRHEISVHPLSAPGTAEAVAWHIRGMDGRKPAGGRASGRAETDSGEREGSNDGPKDSSSRPRSLEPADASLACFFAKITPDGTAASIAAGGSGCNDGCDPELGAAGGGSGDRWSTGVASAVVMGVAARHRKSLCVFPHGKRVLLPILLGAIAFGLSVITFRSCRFLTVMPYDEYHPQVFQLGPWRYLSQNAENAGGDVCLGYPSDVTFDSYATVARSVSALAACFGGALTLWVVTLSCVAYSREALIMLGFLFILTAVLQMCTVLFYLSDNCRGGAETADGGGGGYFQGAQCALNQDLVFCLAASSLYLATGWILFLAQRFVAPPGYDTAEVYTWSAIADDDEAPEGKDDEGEDCVNDDADDLEGGDDYGEKVCGDNDGNEALPSNQKKYGSQRRRDEKNVFRTVEKCWTKIPDGSTVMATVLVERRVGKDGSVRTTHSVQTEILPAD